jgi:hypothetical protein
MNKPDFESPGEKLDPALQLAWEHLDTDIDVRISQIAEELNLDRDKVVALSVMFFATQLRMRADDKMVIVCGAPATAYADPLAALFDQEESGTYSVIYDQLTGR